MKRNILLFAAMLAFGTCLAQGNVSNVNINVNVNNPTSTKEPKKEKPKVVYVEKPGPTRVARKLAAPVRLQGYLWVYPEDLGQHSNVPTSVIRNINEQGKYGRDNWRVPTDEEIELMKNEADKAGLGPLYSYAYLSYTTSGYGLRENYHSGTVRLVSTGPSIADKKATEDAAKKKQAAEAEAVRKKKRDADNAQKSKIMEEQQAEINAGRAFIQGNLLWRTRNMDAKRDTDPGAITTNTNLTDGWRLPTAKEFRTLINNSREISAGFRYGQKIIPYGVYLITDNGVVKTYNVKLGMVLDGKSGLVRAVQELK